MFFKRPVEIPALWKGRVCKEQQQSLPTPAESEVPPIPHPESEVPLEAESGPWSTTCPHSKDVSYQKQTKNTLENPLCGEKQNLLCKNDLILHS